MRTLSFVLFLSLSLLCACGQNSGSTLVYTDRNGVALGGYDPVAYFKENKAVKGLSELRATYQGATYYFSSSENQEGFIFNPTKYAPQFGGYCAYAASKNSLVKADPTVFEIRDGRLLLQYSRDVKRLWDKDPDNFLKKADKNWPGLVKKHGK